MNQSESDSNQILISQIANLWTSSPKPTANEMIDLMENTSSDEARSELIRIFFARCEFSASDVCSALKACPKQDMLIAQWISPMLPSEFTADESFEMFSSLSSNAARELFALQFMMPEDADSDDVCYYGVRVASLQDYAWLLFTKEFDLDDDDVCERVAEFIEIVPRFRELGGRLFLDHRYLPGCGMCLTISSFAQEAADILMESGEVEDILPILSASFVTLEQKCLACEQLMSDGLESAQVMIGVMELNPDPITFMKASEQFLKLIRKSGDKEESIQLLNKALGFVSEDQSDLRRRLEDLLTRKTSSMTERVLMSIRNLLH